MVNSMIWPFFAAFVLPLDAPAPDDLAARFGAREFVEQMRLSPDGNRVAIIESAEGRAQVLAIGDLVAGDGTRIILAANGKPERLAGCRWVSNVRLICEVYLINDTTDHMAVTRQVSIDAEGKGLKMVDVRQSPYALGFMQFGGSIVDWGPEGKDGSVMMTRQFVPEQTTGRLTAETREGLGVEIVDVATLERRVVEQPNRDARGFISDGHGAVRIMATRNRNDDGYSSNVERYYYRTTDSRQWKPLSTVTSLPDGRSEGFEPVAVDRDTNRAIGFEKIEGRLALVAVSLDGTLTRTTLVRHPDVDVDGLVRIGRSRRVVGASFATDRRQVEFFDPELRKLSASLGRALPNKPIVTFVDASADESKLLLLAGGDNDPGTYYRYDKATRRLEEILPVRPPLAKVALAHVEPVRFPAADGTMIPGYLTLPVGSSGKGLPAIVLPHGGPGSRDEWGFDWLSQYFAARGYAVLQPNFRGSTGYGDSWFQNNGFQSWKTAIGDVNDAGRWLVAKGIARADQLGIVGWSYGGYAALQSGVLDPDLFKAIVAVAPVTDLETLRDESRNFTSFPMVDRFIGHGDHVRAGSPARNAERIKAPVLLFHGSVDINVGVGESRMMADRLKAAGRRVEYVEFKGLDHQLADDAARTTLLSRSDAFLREAMSIRP